MEQKKSSLMETTTLNPVPADEKRKWLSIAFVWMGSSICVPGLMVGGIIAGGLPFGMAALAMVLGFSLVAVYMVLIGIQSADLGVPSTVAFSRAFGTRGSGVAVGLVIALGSGGWFAFQTYVCGSSFCLILNDFLHMNFPLWLSCIIWGVAMFITSVYGIKLIDILNKISVPLLTVMLIYGVGHALMQPGAIEKLVNYESEAPITFIAGLTFAVSAFAVGAVISGDYTRYCKSRKDTVLASAFGVIPAGAGVQMIGGVLAITAGNYDITMMFSNIGLPILGLVTLILATWTTNTGNIYSAGIAFVNVFKLKDDKRSAVTLILGVICTILAVVGIINMFQPFLNFLSTLLPPLAGVVIADYWILGKGRPEDWKPWDGVNWLGIISWACGTAFGMIFTTFLIPTINAIVVSMIVYLILAKLVKNPKLNPFA